MSVEAEHADLSPIKEITLTPFLTSLLKPSADYLGKELRSYLEATVAQWKEHRRSENLRRHIDAAQKRLEQTQDDRRAVNADVLEQLELFEEWVDGAQDVDPREAELSQIWQELLCEIARGARPSRLLLKVLRQLDGETSRLLLKLRDDPHFRPKSSRDVYHMKQLNALELVEERQHEWILIALPLGMVALIVSARFVNPKIFSGLSTSADWIMFILRMLPYIVLPFLGLAAVVLALFLVLPKWRLSWLGIDLLHYAPRAASSLESQECRSGKKKTEVTDS